MASNQNLKLMRSAKLSNLPTFGNYAADFEQSLRDNDWTRLEQYFATDSSYLPGDGSEAVGRAAVMQALQDSVNALERKCDTRELIGEPDISEAGDTITLNYELKYTKSGLPDLHLKGCETVDYANGLIQRMEDVFENQAEMQSWQTKL